MRTHADIIKAAGGAQALHDRLGFTGKINTVRSWAQRNSIPKDQWPALQLLGAATTEELLSSSRPRKMRAEDGHQGKAA